MNKLDTLRKHLKLNQIQMAEKMGVSQSTYHRYQKNDAGYSNVEIDSLYSKLNSREYGEYSKEWFYGIGGNEKVAIQEGVGENITRKMNFDPGTSYKIVGEITAEKIFEFGEISGSLKELRKEHEELKRAHNKLLQGVSKALGDYASTYGPIDDKATGGDTTAPTDRTSGNSDPSARPRRDEDSTVPGRTG